jgi:hypothetical protein
MDFSVDNQNVTIRDIDVWLWWTSLSVCLWQTKSDGGDVGIWLQRNSMNRLNGFGIMPMKGSSICCCQYWEKILFIMPLPF